MVLSFELSKDSVCKEACLLLVDINFLTDWRLPPVLVNASVADTADTERSAIRMPMYPNTPIPSSAEEDPSRSINFVCPMTSSDSARVMFRIPPDPELRVTSRWTDLDSLVEVSLVFHPES